MNGIAAQGEPTVYVVDDDSDVLRSLTRLLRANGYKTEPFKSAAEFLLRAPDFGLGCAIVDLHMPEMSGLSLQESLLRAGSIMPLIFLTGRGDFPSSVQAVKRGAVDYLAKPVESAKLLPTIDAAIQGHAALMADAAEVGELLRLYESLTPREREVCSGVSRGLLNKQIGGELGIAEKTIKVHRGRVMEKLRVNSVPELVRILDRLGIGQQRHVNSAHAQ